MSSESMEPTIAQGALVTVDQAAYESERIERSDLVCFRPDEYPDLVFVFRIAGLPYETVSLDDSTIFANGRPTEINGIEHLPYGFLAEPITLEPDEYFVLGDNSKEARDSRFFGPIKRTQILGKVISIQQPASGNPDEPDA